ncbi:MAG: GH3 auxin-responsive promoter family protein [Acetobacteraceae bacterium]|nr:GH3 auxin-responsive promoter family protein [Acetobacteraceae bacterium]
MRRAPLDGTPLLRLWARRRLAALARLDPVAAQRDLLRRLLRRAAGTRFGRDHGFAGLNEVRAFQSAVPLRRYEAMWDTYWRGPFPVLENVSWPGRVPYVALSSGTTSGTTKHIPVTREMVAANRLAAADVLAWHLESHPAARPFGALSFMLGGSTDLTELAPGVRAGDLSGIAAAEVPALMRAWTWPPTDIALLPDWTTKLARLLAETPAGAIGTLTGTPSWLLVLLEGLAARHGTPPLPGLELLIHGGTAWAPYRDRIAPFLPPGCATREVFPASEGFFAIADRGDGEGMRLSLDRGVFFEFVPVEELDAPNPTRHWVADIEPGVDYALVVTSCAGLWAYVVGDVVRFVGTRPPRLLMVGRTAWMLSTFGEHVTGAELAEALARSGCDAAEWMVGAEFDGALGRHRWLVEGAAPDPAALDAALAAMNDDYRAHRQGGQLAPPVVETLPPGRFRAWMEAIGKGGGQHKLPRVMADPARFESALRGLR